MRNHNMPQRNSRHFYGENTSSRVDKSEAIKMFQNGIRVQGTNKDLRSLSLISY
jgi:hypothetical protein